VRPGGGVTTLLDPDPVRPVTTLSDPDRVQPVGGVTTFPDPHPVWPVGEVMTLPDPLSYEQLKLAHIENGWGLLMMSHSSVIVSMGGGWFKTQRIKEITKLSL